ncbi:MAG: enoyl-CoA hydratase-related protein [Actinomycetota bacterium]
MANDASASPTPPEQSGDGPPTLYGIDGGVATITLNRPDRKNSLSPELLDGIGDDLDRAMGDDSVRAVLLTNTGNTFCAGADLKAAAPGVAGSEPRHSFVGVLSTIMDAPKPVIGRIDGHATGGGVGLTAACDLAIMRDDAKIGFTEVRIGVAPAVISVVCLPKMRRADAMELFLTGERFTPARAADAGLITAAVPPDEIDDAVDRYLSMIVRGGPTALTVAKELVNRVPGTNREEAFAWTAVRSQELFGQPEAAEGIAAFRQRRDPSWVPAD